MNPTTNPHKILFLGDSHCRRLGNYVETSRIGRKGRKDEDITNFRFGLDWVTVRFCGIGGIKTFQLLKNDTVKTELTAFEPQTVVLIIGNNDIKSGTTPGEVLNLIISTVGTLKARYSSVESVVINQLLPRYPGARGNIDEYNIQAKEINDQLGYESHIRPNVARHHCKFCFPSEDWNAKRYLDAANLFLDDGVHLTEEEGGGNWKLYKSLRSVVIIYV